ncbi:MAG TPA: hypothetical protein VMT75_08900 [Candidatus Saccharimonadales bacterium]|nr:hypothetical protein [Candidatus Saccharimonadales bacterium]
MNYWLILAIALAAIATAGVLLYVLKSRLGENDVWEELIDPNSPVREPDSRGLVLKEGPKSDAKAPSEDQARQESKVVPQQLKVEPMTIPTSSQGSRSFRGADLRRSSRLELPISLVVMGTDRRGETFQEKTSALSFNLHGCRYSSHHDYPTDGWVTLQVTGTDGMNAPPVRARVRSVVLPKGPRDLSQVGVELETPANIWGVHQTPEDWDRLLKSNPLAARLSAMPAATGTAAAPVAPPHERKAEVTVFPSPAAPAPETPPAATPRTDRLVLTPDQLLQALQGKLQQGADRAMQTAITTHLNEAVRAALAKIDDAFKSNIRQAEEFSTSRLGEAQNRWERELVVYRSRAEEVSRRMEALAAAAQQSLVESQKVAQSIKTEIEPQMIARIGESFERAKSEFAANVAEISGQRISQVSETTQAAALEAQARIDERLAEMRSLANGPATAATGTGAGITDERLQEVATAARNEVLQRVEERLSEIWTLFEQQQDLARQRTDQLAAALGQLGEQLQETKASQTRAIEDVRALSAANAKPAAPLAQEQIEPHLQATREQLHNDFEWRLGEVSGKFEQLHAAARKNGDVLADRLDALAAEARSLRAQHEQGFGELRSTLAGLPTPVSQERLDWLLNSTREQLLNHIEWRIGELTSRSEQQHDITRQHAEEIAQRVESLAANTRAQLEEIRTGAENALRTSRPEDFGALQQTVERVTRDFESAATRVSDRQLIRLTEQKQALASEASLELEAQTSEARASLQKAANGMLEEFRRRVELQTDLVTAEATDRVSSSLASLESESRAAVEARKRALESEVARAAEQSTAEFRSGIKAFLYSCLVAAVSAVDQHAQTTLAGLETTAMPGAAPAIENTGNGVPKQDNLSAAANASDGG